MTTLSLTGQVGGSLLRCSWTRLPPYTPM